MSTSFGWEGKGRYGSFRCGWTRGVQVKLWDPLRTRAISERFRCVFTTRRYTNPRLPLPYLLHRILLSNTTCVCDVHRTDSLRLPWHYSKVMTRSSLCCWKTTPVERSIFQLCTSPPRRTTPRRQLYCCRTHITSTRLLTRCVTVRVWPHAVVSYMWVLNLSYDAFMCSFRNL